MSSQAARQYANDVQRYQDRGNQCEHCGHGHVPGTRCHNQYCLCDTTDDKPAGVPLGTDGPDFTIRDEGSVWVFQPKTEIARNKVPELGLEPYQRWAGGAFVLDHRPAQQLVEALEDEGFTFGKIS